MIISTTIKPNEEINLTLIKLTSLKIDILVHKCDQRVVIQNVQEKLWPMFAKGQDLGWSAKSENVITWIKRDFPGNTISMLLMGPSYANALWAKMAFWVSPLIKIFFHIHIAYVYPHVYIQVEKNHTDM